MSDYDHIQKLELELISPDTRMNASRLDELLADDFKEFGSSGHVIDKDTVLSSANLDFNTIYKLSNFSYKTLCEGCVLIYYFSSWEGKRSYRSSIWVKKDNRWQMLHHQSTIIPTHHG
ncbi:hypothetical protein Q672_14955 [Marinobacter sp. EVN1]|uniref:nuclear transport factor 2 family protein n=1 Tax=Marinobacter sp. EVN1 TaxID=1397532 RepID=UPI0003B8E1E8|nr:nuclear transport factor 2 family protein [Marinobacter sp. EVN1]ERS86184.1 hypothetical protein Q672_14955 [Marinobacter sp. EVN1]